MSDHPCFPKGYGGLLASAIGDAMGGPVEMWPIADMARRHVSVRKSRNGKRINDRRPVACVVYDGTYPIEEYSAVPASPSSRGFRPYPFRSVPDHHYPDQTVGHEPQFPGQPVPPGGWASVKRGLDIGLSCAAVPFLIPLWLVLAVFIKLESRGPVIFRQVRIGQGGRAFVLYKFRSMFDGAEKDTGPVWATNPDPRSTRVGRFMRRFGLDETVQLANVFRGEMSLVGPRPERPYFVERLRPQIPNYETRLLAKPGITGWAQIHTDHKYDVSLSDVETKVAFDMEYIRRWSLWLDLKILAWTLVAILRMRRIPRRG